MQLAEDQPAELLLARQHLRRAAVVDLGAVGERFAQGVEDGEPAVSAVGFLEFAVDLRVAFAQLL